MSGENVGHLASLVHRQPKPDDYLSFDEIEQEYCGIIKAGTLCVWSCTHRYNFHELVTKIGRKSVVRRDRWEKFLESRTGGRNSQDARP